jgi:hypothetical protein
LKEGGALLLFASGGIDPDPAHMPGSEEAIDCWSQSLDLFIRRVPNTQVLISMVSGILTPKYIRHPLTRFRKLRPDKQRISEFLQVMNQMLNPGQLIQKPRISFAMPFTVSGLPNLRDHPMFSMDQLRNQAKNLLQDHLKCSLG